MSEETYKFLSVLVTAIFGTVPAIFAYLSLRESKKNSKKLDNTENKLDVMHDSVNGLLKEKAEADKEIGKKQGKAEEKQEQKDRDDLKT